MRVMVSACLLGWNCKYNGGNNLNRGLIRLLEGHTVIPVCPEVLGGLPVPRIPAEIREGTAVNRDGVSVDGAFRLGARKALRIAEKEKPDLLILQSRSPSSGVFAAMAAGAGFRVTDVEDFLSGTLAKGREEEKRRSAE